MSKLIRYSIKALAITLGVIVLLYAAAYLYIISKKKQIIQQVREQVADKLNGEINIGDIDISFLSDFPSIAVQINNVSIHDTLFQQHKFPFFKAREVTSGISLLKLMRKDNPLNDIKIEDGELYIYTDTSGYTNSYLLHPKVKDTLNRKPSTAKTEIDEIKLRNVHLVMDNRQKNKLFDFDVTKLTTHLSYTGDRISFKNKADILVHHLAFKTTDGSFLRNTRFESKFKMQLNKRSKELSFSNIDISLSGQPFNLTGVFAFVSSPQFFMDIKAKKVDFRQAKTFLTEKINKGLSKVDIAGKLDDVVANISGGLKGGQPLVKVSCRATGNDVQSPFGYFKNCSFTGSYNNQVVDTAPRTDENSRIHLENFTGYFEQVKVTSGSANIDNLKQPFINCDLKSQFTFQQLDEALGSETIQLGEGEGNIDLTYSGPIEDNTNRNTIINGKVTLKNGRMFYIPRQIQLTDFNCNILFNNTDVNVAELRGNVKGTRVAMNGYGKNLLALIGSAPSKAYINWNVAIPSLNLANFTSLLQKRNVASPQSKGRASKAKLYKVSQRIDNIVNYANFSLDVKVNELLYHKFKAQNVRASVSLANENWYLNKVSLQHGGGLMTVSGSLEESGNDYYRSRIKALVQDADVNKIMYAFDNFGQSGIEYQNLRGKLTATADVSMNIDRNLKKSPSDISGAVDFSLKNGALVSYEPIKKIQHYIFKNRNFDDIRFAELKDRIELNNTEIKINRMEIQSTALTLFVEGVYSLKGNTDISIQVPLSNLKKRDDEFTPVNKGADSKGGASIYLRGKPDDKGNVQFKVDLFKKFRKKDKTNTR